MRDAELACSVLDMILSESRLYRWVALSNCKNYNFSPCTFSSICPPRIAFAKRGQLKCNCFLKRKTCCCCCLSLHLLVVVVKKYFTIHMTLKRQSLSTKTRTITLDRLLILLDLNHSQGLYWSLKIPAFLKTRHQGFINWAIKYTYDIRYVYLKIYVRSTREHRHSISGKSYLIYIIL